MQPDPYLAAVDTIRRRMNRSAQSAESIAADTSGGTPAPPADHPSSISHVRFATLSSRLAQVAAKASADAIAAPASAHEPMSADTVLRLLSDIRRMAEAIAAISAGDAASDGSGEA